MGYERYHAIIVSSSFEDKIEEAHKQALFIFGPQVSNIVPWAINHGFSFFVGPDGSKEGWEESDFGDKQRESFLKRLDRLRYDDGSSPVDWVEVQFGDEQYDTKITAHSDEELRQLAPMSEGPETQ